METKEKIIETAFKIFLTKGYNDCSISDLVNETKLSKGAFYHHFKNKAYLYQSVIDTYFISYYDQVDWDKMKKMTVGEIEAMIKTYYSGFLPEIMKITDNAMSRYFIMFFEAYTIYPKFKKTVRNIYEQLKSQLEEAYKKEKSQNPTIDAIALISKYEGLIFWIALYPEERINELIMKI